MKKHRITGLAVILMALVGTVAAGASRAAAQTGKLAQLQAPPAAGSIGQIQAQPAAEAVAQVQDQFQVQGCDVEGNDGPEAPAAEAADADTVECGQQDGPEDTASDPAGPDEQSPSYAGSISMDQSATEGQTEDEESAALAEQATISEEQAKAAALNANPGASVVAVELDNENGALVYSVELSNGLEVKIDAGNGAVLHTESGGDHED